MKGTSKRQLHKKYREWQTAKVPNTLPYLGVPVEQQMFHSADSFTIDARNTASLINNLSTKISERTNRFNEHFNSNIKSKVNFMQTAPGSVLTPTVVGLTTQSAETPRKLLPLKRI